MREMLYPVLAEEKEDSSTLISAPSRHTWEGGHSVHGEGAFVPCPLGAPRYEQSAAGSAGRDDCLQALRSNKTYLQMHYRQTVLIVGGP